MSKSYDTEKINQIPIERVLAFHEVDAASKNMYSIHPQDNTPSAYLGKDKELGNVLCDLKTGTTYDPISLTAYLRGVSEEEAARILGETFGIKPVVIPEPFEDVKSYDEIDFKKYGVNPEDGKKKNRKDNKEKKPSLFQLLNPKNLQTEVSKYGYNFSAKNFYLSMLAAMGGAVGVGFIFKLDWYFILIVLAVCLLCMPSVLLTSFKNMYESKRFHDVSNYMEQLLYSFRRKKKILTSLEDVLIAFEDDDGPMKRVITQAIQYLRTSDSSGDIYREALNIIEEEYANDRLRNVHNFLIAVENNGGSVENPVDLLLDERAMWDERIHTFQKERDTLKRNITVSIICSVVLCFFILYILSVDSLKDLAIIKNLVVQSTSTLVIVLNVFLFVKITNKLSQSWLKRESKQTNAQILKDYFYVETYDKKKETKKSVLLTLALSPVAILGLILNNKIILVIGIVVCLFTLFAGPLSYKLSRKSVIKEIEKTFPQWLMELALLLQGDNVQVAISKTLDSAPVVLRPELEKLVSGFDVDPHSSKPYNNFLSGYDLPEIKSAMKMLYSITATGTGNIDEQITDLIKKQNVLMDKAEKINNNDHIAGLSTLSMVPMLFCIVKSVIDMTILVFSLFSMINY